MHEIGVMSSALTAVLAEARRHGADRVRRIVLRVGALSGAEPAALHFAFEVVARGTPAEGAALQIETVPAVAHCAACRLDFEPDSGFIAQCPRCRGLSGELRRGRELELAQVELSCPTPSPAHHVTNN
jgi:hydrogenase nickel incorporation protein HypA/HybF